MVYAFCTTVDFSYVPRLENNDIMLVAFEVVSCSSTQGESVSTAYSIHRDPLLVECSS